MTTDDQADLALASEAEGRRRGWPDDDHPRPAMGETFDQL
jgi:hypothetical protein